MSIIAFASFILAVACLAGAAALGGREIAEHGWTSDNWHFRVSDRDGRRSVERVSATDRITRDLPWTGEVLSVDLPADVTYIQGDAGRIFIEGPKDIVDRIRVENGRISYDGDLIQHSGDVTIDINGVRIIDDAERLRITVTAPTVNSFSVNGSGDLDIQGYDQPKMTVAVQGSGDVTGVGKTQTLELGVVGSGSIDVGELAAGDAEVDLSGSGDATVNANGTVKIAIAGSGGVKLRAKPASLTSEISGSGDVDQDY
ncbi:MAG TPA: DUF2807 domain-containing protein [Caulobacter sp.]|nr:DUF2807 domain-containing protein [Caulobacter sp.]